MMMVTSSLFFLILTLWETTLDERIYINGGKLYYIPLQAVTPQ